MVNQLHCHFLQRTQALNPKENAEYWPTGASISQFKTQEAKLQKQNIWSRNNQYPVLILPQKGHNFPLRVLPKTIKIPGAKKKSNQAARGHGQVKAFSSSCPGEV